MTIEVAPSTVGVGLPKQDRRVRELLRQLGPGEWIAVGLLAVIIIVSVLAPLLAPYDPSAQDTANSYTGPSGEHWLGTDGLGRDTLSRLMYAGQLSLTVGFGTVLLALVLAVPVGLLAGYAGGWVDVVLMRITDAGLSFPPIVLAMAVAGSLGASTKNMVLALAFVFAPSLARLIRSQALAIREETFISASRVIGTRPHVIVLRRVLPNLRGPLLVSLSFKLANALIAEASLSYLGLGAQPPAASWGSMLRQGYDSALYTDPLQLVWPGLALALTVLSLTTLADSLRRGLGGELGTAKTKQRGVTEAARSASGAPKSESGAALEVQNLGVRFSKPSGESVQVLKDVDFRLRSGEVLGIVGESGSGKSVTSLSLTKLVPSPPGLITSGSVIVDGQDLVAMSLKQLRAVRGKKVAMVFQDPMTSLDPAFTVGHQLVEAIRLHADVSANEARERAASLLAQVGISDPKDRISDYPHQFSGGMRQRVMIAMALASNPQVLIADEPTTGLDVTIQAQVLALFKELQRDLGLSIIFVTHDLGVVSEVCHRAIVMYAGEIVEEGDVHELFSHPLHPYTEGLLGAMPEVTDHGDHLKVIPGTVPSLDALPTGCRFSTRCAYATDVCSTPVPLIAVGDQDRRVRCHRFAELTLQGAELTMQGAP